jgi:hypothetical protein
MRLRKPGGGAQPGEVSPVLVAALALYVVGERNPMEVLFADEPIWALSWFKSR